MSIRDKKIVLSSINKRLAWKLSLIVFAGLAFSFAVAPLYDVMCREFGLNGRADSTATKIDTSQKVDKTRWVTVIFTGNTMPGLGWSFHPKQISMKVHPGEITMTSYTAKNNAQISQLGVAVPSITPELATLYFKKIECFCFKEQTLKAGENKEMPIMFYVKPDIPADVHTVTLNYAFYNGNAGLSQAALTEKAASALN